MAPTPVAQLRSRKEKPGPGRLVVPLPSRPPPYQPGSGPPLQRIRLLPPRDSTAYIVERILLPSPGPAAADGKPLPRRMTYIVGWPDLPAARLLVPAMQILEYVSPRALEEWEANMELELDEDRRMLAEEQESSGTQKKGRPPAHTEIESAAVAEAETDTQSRPKVPAMSLSTPKKTRLEDFEGFTDYDDGSPSVQLARESGWQEDEGDGFKVISDVQDAAATGWTSLDEEEEEEEDDDDEGGFDRMDQGMPFGTQQFTSASNTQNSRLLSTQTLTSGGDLSQVTSGGFTPFNQNRRLYSIPQASRRSSAPFHISAAPAAPAATTTPTAEKQSKPRKKSTPAKKAKPAPKPAAVSEQDWVVKKIEDMQLYEVEGRGLVRYFKVLWEGNWPPDQNPTWEPEENIPANLVRNYFKRGKKRGRSRANHSKSMKRRPLGANLHYGSVSEAFAGEVADDGYIAGTPTGDEEEELVVDESQHHVIRNVW